MTFLHPTLALAGAACIAVPIIIHILMRRRRRPILWGAMRFLLEAMRKQRKRLRLEQILLLATRCLLVLMVGLAIGRPLLGAAGVFSGRAATTLYILLDNSLAASATDTAGQSALARHRASAARVLAGLDGAAGDRAGLIALAAPAEPLIAPASPDIAGVRRLIDEVAPAHSAADLAGAAAILHDRISGDRAEGRTVVLVLSDFLEGSVELDRTLAALGARVSVVASRPAAAGVSNVSIVGVEPLRPVLIAPGAGGPGEAAAPTGDQVRVLLRRSGPGVNEPGVTKVRLRVQGKDGPGGVSETVTAWTAGAAEATAILSANAPGSTGAAVLIAEIDRDAIAPDNTWRRPIEVRSGLRVGLISPRQSARSGGLNPDSAADWLRLALSPESLGRERWRAGGPDSDVEVVGVEPGALDAARLAALDAAVVASPDAVSADGWRRLRLLADAGGVVIVVPPPEATVHLWADSFTREFGLDWTVSREARELGDGGGVSAARGPFAPGEDLFALFAAELPDLVKPVRVRRALAVEFGAGTGEAALRLIDGTPLVVVGSPGASPAAEGSGEGQGPRRGLVVLLTVSPALGWTDLPTKPLFIPLVQEVLRQGVGRARGSWSERAGARPAVPAGAIELRPLTGWGDGDTAAEPVGIDESGRAARPIRTSGLYSAADDRGGTRALIAINADARGGRGEAQAPEAVRQWLAGLGGRVEWVETQATEAGATPSEPLTLSRGESDDRLSVPLLMAALALAAIELALARWFSHADARSARPVATKGAAA